MATTYLLHDDKENDSGSTDSLDSFEKVPSPTGVNCLRTINTTEILDYLTPKDEAITRRYPAISVSRCPKELSLECLPGLYNIVSCNFREAGAQQKEGRVFFACPNSRERFLNDWEQNYSTFYPTVKIQPLENFGKLTWQLPIKRFTFPDKSPYPLFHRLACCFADLPDNTDIKNMDITFIEKSSWLFERHGPHFLCVANIEKRKEIEAQIAENITTATVERPCLGSCVAIRSPPKYPAARGIIYSRRLNFANIYLVDYGISEEFPDTCLSPINPEIMELPFLAVPCKLAITEPIEASKVQDVFEKAKNQGNVEFKKVWYRGFFNIVDAFIDIAQESYLAELLENNTKRKPQLPFRSYDKEDMMNFKNDNRAKAFVNALDQLTYIESQALYKATIKRQK